MNSCTSSTESARNYLAWRGSNRLSPVSRFRPFLLRQSPHDGR